MYEYHYYREAVFQAEKSPLLAAIHVAAYVNHPLAPIAAWQEILVWVFDGREASVCANAGVCLLDTKKSS